MRVSVSIYLSLFPFICMRVYTYACIGVCAYVCMRVCVHTIPLPHMPWFTRISTLQCVVQVWAGVPSPLLECNSKTTPQASSSFFRKRVSAVHRDTNTAHQRMIFFGFFWVFFWVFFFEVDAGIHWIGVLGSHTLHFFWHVVGEARLFGCDVIFSDVPAGLSSICGHLQCTPFLLGAYEYSYADHYYFVEKSRS